MRQFLLYLLLSQSEGVLCQYIANDVVNDYAQVKELLTQFYRRTARRYGNDYDPADVLRNARVQSGNDGTEGSVNRHIWAEVFENDIILTLPQAEAILGELGSKRQRRQAAPNPSSFWPNLTISYEFAHNDASFKNLIRSALRHIEQNTCIRFKENGNDRDRVRYFRGSGCWSNVGKAGGRQLVSIGYGCDSVGIVAHETLHALGLWHEQSRVDRDDYIRIKNDRIIRGTEGNFEKRTPTNSDNLGQPYDLGSVMHYGSKSFTYDWSVNTIETKDERFQNTIGQRDGISFKDAKMINLRYCTGICQQGLHCEHDGYPDPNDCNRCRCPKGYGGVYCTDVEPTSCGGELVATSSYESVKSGNVYANSHCVWRIKSPIGQKVEVVFDMVNFPCFDACTSFVEVKSARSKTSTGARLCCKSGYTFHSEDNEVTLIFRGDSKVQNGYFGFSARYRYFGNPVYTRAPYVTHEPMTTTLGTSTTELKAEWGLWGEWSSCSERCGGGLRTRVRACYGGNNICPGSCTQTLPCNTQKCNDYKGQSTCYGRILMPCDLTEKLSFGQEALQTRAKLRDLHYSSLYADKRGYFRGGTIARRSLDSRGDLRANANYLFCERRFTYECPTSLLTIHMGWK